MKINLRRIMTFILLFLGICTVATFIFLQHPLFGKEPQGERLKRIHKSPNFKNGQFHNLSKTPALAEGVTYFSAIKDMVFAKPLNTKPTDSIPFVKTNLSALGKNNDFLVWFGHSSYFMMLNGKSYLIDPVLTKNASPLYGTNVAFKGADTYHYDLLPAIDVLLLTHDHYDHLDYTTFKNLKHKISKIVCPLGVGSHLEYWGYPKERIIELDWYEHIDLLQNTKITAAPARHFSGRGFKRNNTLWASFIIETINLKLYIGGDSGYDSHFKTIGDQFGPFDLAILENGQYDYKWKYIHKMPKEVVKASNDLKAKRFFPVHNAKFKLANHAWKEPLDKVNVYSLKQNATKMIHPKIGEVVYLNQTDQTFEKWWEKVN